MRCSHRAGCHGEAAPRRSWARMLRAAAVGERFFGVRTGRGPAAAGSVAADAHERAAPVRRWRHSRDLADDLGTARHADPRSGDAGSVLRRWAALGMMTEPLCSDLPRGARGCVRSMMAAERAGHGPAEAASETWHSGAGSWRAAIDGDACPLPSEGAADFTPARHHRWRA